MPTRPLRFVSILLFTTALAGSAPASAAAQATPIHYAATAINMLAPPGNAAMPINIVVTRWTSRAEQEQVMAALLELGERAFLEALRKMPSAGSIAPVGGVGFSVRYATLTRLPNGTDRVVMFTDRPMSFAERWDGGRTTDYAVTWLELTLNPSGRGAGQAIAAARVRPDAVNRSILIENYNDQPIRLQNVQRMK